MKYGWFIVAVAFVIYMTVVGSTFTAFGLFVLPVSQEFHLSRADTNTAMIILNIGQAILAPFVGWLLDRVNLKVFMAMSAVGFGFSLVGLGFSHSHWLSAFILAVPLAGSCLGAALIAVPVLIARWFDERRGMAMVLAATGLSMGAIVVTPGIGWLIEVQGWRGALITVGTIAGIVMLALILIARDRPYQRTAGSDRPVEIDTAESKVAVTNTEPRSIRQVVSMAPFWLIAISTAIATAIAQATVITIVPIAIEGGSTPLRAASLISVVGLTAITAKLLLAIFADKIDRVWILVILIVAGVTMNAALLTSHVFVVLVGSAGLLGFTSGAMAPFLYALLADRFGLKLFGTVQGLCMLITSIASAATVRLAGEVFDRTGSYDLLFTIFVVGEILALVMMCSVGFMKPRAQSTGRYHAA